MTRRQIGWLTCVVAIAVTVVLVVASCRALIEAYGPGPPYFGRTTNMDKWSDPLPVLILVDGIGLLVAGMLARIGLQFVRSKR